MNTKGFTLIELLVVVLIIGILSSVALPQYQKTVLKSRAAEAWANLNAIYKASQSYCLENPTGRVYSYSEIKEALPITVENSNNFTYDLYFECSANDIQPFASYSKGGKSFSLGIDVKGRRLCSGKDCRDLGFVSYDSDASCMSGVGDSSGCYYMN